MKRFMLLMLAVGTALLGVILWQTDLTEVWSRLRELGGWGVAAIFGVFALAFVAESGAWLLTLARVPPTPAWLFRFVRVLLVGMALEYTTPLAGLGASPSRRWC